MFNEDIDVGSRGIDANDLISSEVRLNIPMKV